MNSKELVEILEKHKNWLAGSKGQRADLRDADLCDADLCGANLRGADLCDANLRGANLCDADLRDADLCDADLRDANLCGADLRDADLRGANLCGADLRGADLCDADLRDANLCGAKHNYRTAFFPLQCPEEGSFIGFKKASGYIVKLEIPEDAKRSSATSRKCRASKAKVISIETVNGGVADIDEVRSNFDPDFIYRIGSTVQVPDFDSNRWAECAPGIHFFLTRAEAASFGM